MDASRPKTSSETSETSSEQIKCIMDAIDHGLSVKEALEECPYCQPDLKMGESLRHEDMGWSVPTTFSERV